MTDPAARLRRALNEIKALALCGVLDRGVILALIEKAMEEAGE